MVKEDIEILVSVAGLLLAIGSFLYTYYRTKDASYREQVADLRQEIGGLKHDVVDLKARAAVTESRLEETPTSKALHELAISIEALSGDMRAVVARLDGLADLHDRLEKTVVRREGFELTKGKC
ncbi:MAG: DUF2730 domain-containing protein [Gammaproteobacteria bacterium]|nr:DUF2730 domain-containing protein [Gammaproteobacteria bacterium]